MQTDEERFEKRRAAAALYQQFKNRGGPPNAGSKELPQGLPTCLANLTFLLTGVLDSMERDEAADLIRAHGGKVTSSLSKKTSYLVAGTEAGLAKLAKAEELGTKMLDEDELLDLIRQKSGLPVTKKKADVVVKQEKPSKAAIKTEKVVEKSPKKSPKKTPPPAATKTGSSTSNVKQEKLTPSPSKARAVKVERTDDLPTPQRVETQHERNIASVENQAWVEKYKPTSLKQIIGQQGAQSNVAK